MRSGIVLCLLCLLAGTAAARPLTRDEVRRAEKAAQDRVRARADRAAMTACGVRYAKVGPGAAALGAAARCYRAAGGVGYAILFWKQLVVRHPRSPQAKVAYRGLGKAYEDAGAFFEAADAYVEYARKFPGAPDAKDQLTRAICARRQLGLDARSQVALLGRIGRRRGLGRRRRRIDPAALCAHLAPIVVPPAPRRR